MKVRLALFALFVSMLCVLVSHAMAEDPVKAAPNNYKVILENDEVRVLDFSAKAGEKIAMHSHPDHTVYVLSGGKAKFTEGGKTVEMDMKEGQAIFMKAGDHSVEVVSGNPHVIVVEMKEEMKKK